MFLASGVIKEPILYLSLYFKMHRDEYYRRLQEVRLEGDWEGWLDFYLRGVRLTARDAVAAANRVKAVYQADRGKIARAGKDTRAVMQIHEAMMIRQAASPKRLMLMTGLTRPSVSSALKTLRELKIVSETTGQMRNTRYRYDRTHDVLRREVGAFAFTDVS
jgi:Fic family protein